MGRRVRELDRPTQAVGVMLGLESFFTAPLDTLQGGGALPEVEPTFPSRLHSAIHDVAEAMRSKAKVGVVGLIADPKLLLWDETLLKVLKVGA